MFGSDEEDEDGGSLLPSITPSSFSRQRSSILTSHRGSYNSSSSNTFRHHSMNRGRHEEMPSQHGQQFDRRGSYRREEERRPPHNYGDRSNPNFRGFGHRNHGPGGGHRNYDRRQQTTSEGSDEDGPYAYLPFRIYQRKWLQSIIDEENEYEYDPFQDYPDEMIRSGVVVTDVLPVEENEHCSFVVYCQDDEKFYTVPRIFPLPPPYTALKYTKRWDKRFELKFGKLIDFKIVQNGGNEIVVFRIGPTDDIPVEVVSHRNCFKVRVVFDDELKKLYCAEFGFDELIEPLEGIVPDLVYHCYVEFDEILAKQGKKQLKIFKVDHVAPEQSLAFSSPWSTLKSTNVVDDAEEEIIEVPVIANKLGFRFNSTGIINLEFDVNDPIVICHENETKFEIGTVFHFDYLPHPSGKYFAVTETYNPCPDETILGCNEIDDDVFGFLIKLDLKTEHNGFFYHENLGMIANSNGCLRFLPYSKERSKRCDFVKVYVRVVFNQPAKFDIYDIPDETAKIVDHYEPKQLINVKHLFLVGNEKCFSKDLSNLKLMIDENERGKYSMGDSMEGKFKRDPNNCNSYVSVELKKLDIEPRKILKITDFYGFFVFRANIIIFEALPSNKLLKANPLKSGTTSSSDYHHRFNGYLESNDAGLIPGKKFKTNSSFLHFIIAEIDLNPEAQTPFKYFSQFNSDTHKLDLNQNIALNRHVNRVLNIQMNEKEFVDLNVSASESEASDARDNFWLQGELSTPNHMNDPSDITVMNDNDPTSRFSPHHSDIDLVDEVVYHLGRIDLREMVQPELDSNIPNIAAEEVNPYPQHESTSSQNVQTLSSYVPPFQNLALYQQNPAVQAAFPYVFDRIEALAAQTSSSSSRQESIRRTPTEIQIPEVEKIAKKFDVYND